MDATKLVLVQGRHDVVATMFDVCAATMLDVRVQRFLIWMFVIFFCGECVHRFESLSNLEPHWSGGSSRHGSANIFRVIRENSG